MGHVRQYGRRIEEIRPDHIKRYQFAHSTVHTGAKVLDAACGCGYGTWLLYQKSDRVTGLDISNHAIEWADKYWIGPQYIQDDIQTAEIEKYDVIVSFETLEHLADVENVLRKFCQSTKLLICSVPNEEHYPFKAEKFADDEYPHLRHYIPSEFDELLTKCGFKIESRHHQKNKKSHVEPGTDGMFLIYVCRGSVES